jgi:hypothetical protein
VDIEHMLNIIQFWAACPPQLVLSIPDSQLLNDCFLLTLQVPTTLPPTVLIPDRYTQDKKPSLLFTTNRHNPKLDYILGTKSKNVVLFCSTEIIFHCSNCIFDYFLWPKVK